ncbi:response regulator [Desertivirga brevis]|uniref:response regulator n=1 Tax=Desertivirga brevis TaxID=2810310 RepID=UPI0034E2DD4A
MLILDDDQSILEMMKEVLSYSNYSVVTTQSSEEFFHIIKRDPPDILLVDYLLNGINGGEVCQRIKSLHTTKKVPVIIVSAYASQHDFISLYGCDDTISKPFGLDELLEKVEQCFNNKHQESFKD